MQLSEAQIERFSRHILLPEVGGAGQRKLLASSALVVGAGGLGSPALLYLAAAGVGRLGIVDGDAVELSNLHRQIAHTARDVGRNKALSAAEAIHAIRPDCAVWALPERLRAENVCDALRGYDLVLDGSDNFPTRFLVADACWLAGIPLVSAAVIQFGGQLMTVLPGKGNPCYRCFLPEPPPPETMPTCAQAGVLGPLAGVMGTLQATEALKVLLGLDGLLTHATLVVDALDWSFLTARRAPNPACALCGNEPTIHDVADAQEALCCPEGRCVTASA
ncbi:MAG TPA: HesA/MoeB/ThiF family protein [Planctomycetota bacterium]|nr:HesA/MoeB/ThiF family protein [Planctomycetota bacterium]